MAQSEWGLGVALKAWEWVIQSHAQTEEGFNYTITSESQYFSGLTRVQLSPWHSLTIVASSIGRPNSWLLLDGATMRSG